MRLTFSTFLMQQVYAYNITKTNKYIIVFLQVFYCVLRRFFAIIIENLYIYKWGDVINTCEKIFMCVVEDMSFTKAAAKTYLTQQCISEHIKKLEQASGIQLFERRPKLTLTHAGEIMYQTLLQIQNMENALKLNLSEISRGAMGEIKVGFNATRSRIIMPPLFMKYHNKYPKVKVSVFSDDTSVMTKMLADGKLDVVIGVDAESNELFEMTPLADDYIYLVISDMLLKDKLRDRYHGCKNEFNKGIDISLLQDIPFVRNYPTSTINNLINRFTSRYNISLDTVFSTSDYVTQLYLCSSNQLAAFFPLLICRIVLQSNTENITKNRLNIYPIKGLHDSLKISCITLKYGYKPLYFQDFISFVKQEIELELAWLSKNIKSCLQFS